MKRKIVATLPLLITTVCFTASGQTVQVKHVAANGGSIKIASNYTTISVAGEMAIGRFIGIQSGTIGYLDDDDLQKTEVSVLSSTVYQVRIYPNPNKGSFEVAITTQEEIAMNIALIDNLGRRYNTREVKLVPGTNSIHYNDITPGIWLLRLSSMHGDIAEKVIVIN